MQIFPKCTSRHIFLILVMKMQSNIIKMQDVIFTFSIYNVQFMKIKVQA